MSSVYPGGLDSWPTNHADNSGEVIHAATINDLADSINKIEATVGANPALPATPALLAVHEYNPNPSGSETIFTTTSTSLVDVDATNMAITFTVPDSGSVIVRVKSHFIPSQNGATAGGIIHAGMRDGTTTVAGPNIVCRDVTGNGSTDPITLTLEWLVTGLTPGASKTYKLAIAADLTTGTTVGVAYGGTGLGTNAGGSLFTVWDAATGAGSVKGDTGAQGPTGPGPSYTTTLSNFTQPSVSSTVSVNVGATNWMAAGQVLYVATGGYYTVSSITDGTHVVLTNLGYTGNASPAATISSGSAVVAGGLVGPTGSAGGGGIGSSVLVYRYTVAGSDKTSIDTGVDTADAGSNDWTNGDLLEVYIYSRTDEVVAGSTVGITLNNDSGTNYDNVFERNVNATVSGSNNLAQAGINFGIATGASATASNFGYAKLTIPNFSGTTGFKSGEMVFHQITGSASSTQIGVVGINYRSTSAITRLAITPATSGKKLKVGTQLLIYKRLAS